MGFTKYLPLHFDGVTVEKFRSGYENVLINYFSHDKKSNEFVKTTVNCTEIHKDTLGPEIGIAKTISDRYPNERFFIVKCAFGGTNLYHDWLSPSNGEPYSPTARAEHFPADKERLQAGWAYNELTLLLRDSIALLQADGYEPQIRAFYWMQGESDATAMRHVENYAARFDRLLSDFSTKFSPYLANCIYADGAISEVWRYYRELNAVKQAYAQKNGVRFIDTVAAGLTTAFEPTEAPDTAHYDSTSVVKLGELFAQELCNTLKTGL